MKVFENRGDIIELIAPAGGVVSGVPVEIGQMLVIPEVTAAATVTFAAAIRGVFTGLAKIGSQAWTQGQNIYWDDGNSRFTTVAAASLRAGVAIDAVASGAGDTTTGSVYLDGGLRPDG